MHWQKLDGQRKTKKDFDDFQRRIENSLIRLDCHNINYYIPQPESPYGSCNFIAFTDQALLTFISTYPIKFVYSSDGNEPHQNSNVYKTPLLFQQSGTLEIRSVLPSGKMSLNRIITIEKQELSPGLELSDRFEPGLLLKVAHGHFLDSSKLPRVRDWKNSYLTKLGDISKIENPKSKNNITPICCNRIRIFSDSR